MKILNLPYQFNKIPTIGDGNCLLHSILRCCNKTYQTLDNHDKIKMARILRTDMGKILDLEINGKTFYKTLSRGELEEISKSIKQADIKYMQKYLYSHNWLDFTYLEYLSILFNVNIIIIYNRTGGVYKTGDKELFFKKRNTIFIYYYDQAHFEAMSVETKNGPKTLFDYDTNIVQDIKKFL